MKLICVIPARTTSKRLPNKNFKYFFDRQIVWWIMQEIKKSELFDKIIISTDEGFEYFDIVLYGEERRYDIYKRKNPTYEQTVEDVCLEVLEHEKSEGREYNYMMVVYPTAYALTWEHICQAFFNMLNCDEEWICSSDMKNHKRYGLKYTDDNGGFYFCNVKDFKRIKKLPTNFKYSMPQVDINTIQDWCEAKLHAITLDGRFK